jgi:DNA-binding transcriptional LysR family regulator
MHDMIWDDLRFVLALARTGTMSAAAKHLGVTHTTVSRRLAAFEEQVGVRVFDKHPDGYVATSAGEDLVRVAERMEEEVLSVDARVLGQDERLSGPLRVTTTTGMGVHVADALASFVERFPLVELELSLDYEFRSLTRREADVAIRTTNKPPENLVGRKVARVEFAVYGARSLHKRLGKGAQLKDYPWVMWDARLGAQMTERRVDKIAPGRHVSLRVDDQLMFKEALRAGIGVGFLPCIDCDDDPALERLRDIEPDFGMDVWLLTHPDLRNTARVRAFLDHMAPALVEQRDRFAGVAKKKARARR